TQHCPDDYVKDGLNCKKTIRTSATTVYDCPSGYQQEGRQCFRIVGGKEVKTQPNISYGCPADFKTIGSGSAMKCEKREKKTADTRTDYTCKDGWIKRVVDQKVDCVLLR